MKKQEEGGQAEEVVAEEGQAKVEAAAEAVLGDAPCGQAPSAAYVGVPEIE